MRKQIIVWFIIIVLLISALVTDKLVPLATTPDPKRISNSQVLTTVTKVSTTPSEVTSPVVKYIMVEDFEDNLSSNWEREMANTIYSGTFSTNYARSGTHSLRIELRSTDPLVNGGLRSEITVVKPETAADERTYNFSILLPKYGDENYALDPKGDEIIVKWHNTPDPGEESTYPPLSLHTSGDGHYHLYVCWDDNPMSTEHEMDADGKVTSYDLGTYLTDKGNWVDWTFHVKWGWLASQHPIIQIYKDGKNIFELIDKPNTTNDKIGVSMELGIDRNQWTVKNNPSILTRRVIYYDDVRIQ